MKTTGKMSSKPYKCTGCGKVENHTTNHWGDIYPYCPTCGNIEVRECLEPVPEGYEKPAPWRLCKLGDICEIKG